jgi:hypothetical protein
MRLHTNGRHLALPRNIRLGKMELAVKNGLAYYASVLLTTIKSFIAQGPGKRKNVRYVSIYIHIVLSRSKL